MRAGEAAKLSSTQLLLDRGRSRRRHGANYNMHVSSTMMFACALNIRNVMMMSCLRTCLKAHDNYLARPHG